MLLLTAQFADKLADQIYGQVGEPDDREHDKIGGGIARGVAAVIWGISAFLRDEAHNISNVMNDDD